MVAECIDATAVALRIQKPGGTAELQVPRNVVVEVQVPRTRREDGGNG